MGGLFGLGLLFLVGGLLAAASLAHKGPGGFARGRLVRLGLPLLAFFVLLDPLTDYLGALAEGEHPRLWPYLADQTGTRDTGPLWCVAVLLALSLAYAGLRRLRPARVGVTAGVGPRQLAAVAAVIAAGSFMMRLVSPLAADTFANLTWAAWPQATGLFTLGVLAGERGRLEGLDRRWLRRWGWAAVAGLLALAVLAASALATDRGDAVAGGWTWQAAALALLEGLVAGGLSLWVVAWFRRRWDRRGSARPPGRPGILCRLCAAPTGAGAGLDGHPTAAADPGRQVRLGRRRRCGGLVHLGAALTWRRVVVHVERPRVA